MELIVILVFILTFLPTKKQALKLAFQKSYFKIPKLYSQIVIRNSKISVWLGWGLNPRP